MARSNFGGGVADYVFGVFPLAGRQLLDLEPATLTLWSAKSGGTRYTDLLLDGVGVTSIPVGTDGQVPQFQGPDGVTSLWADAGGARVLMANVEQVAAAAVAAAASINREAANGVAGLDGSGLLYEDRLPSRLRAVNAPTLNAKAYGATGNGTTDDTAAIQAAITAAGVGGTTVLPPGTYKVTSNLSVPVWGTLEGTASNLGSGPTATTELVYGTITGSTIGITLGSQARIRNLVVRGPGYSVGTCTGISGATMRLHQVSIVGFATGVLSTGGYYNGYNEVEWLRNGTGLKMVGCYNVSLYGCRFDCTTGATYGVGIDAGTVRGLNLHGTAIEAYSIGVIVGSASQLAFYSVYMESLSTGAVGIDAHSVAGLSVLVQGCFIYLDHHAIWLRTDGSTSTSLRARGNYFVAGTGSTTTPYAYKFTSGQDVDLDGDNWFEVAKVGSVYADSSTGTIFDARVRIGFPSGSQASYGTTANPVLMDARVRVVPQRDQTLASAGAVTFNAASEVHRCTLSANATSSTITNAAPSQEILITFQQDATGGRTYVWPANCQFAGGAAPAGTAASTRNTVRFRYDSLTGKWHEIARAAAVPA